MSAARIGDAVSKQVLSFETLRKAGLRYLERYAASTNAFKLVLKRKVIRMVEGDLEQRPVEVEEWISEIVDRFTKAGLLNDSLVAENLCSSLLRRGTSLKMVKAKLAAKGFERDVISRVLDDISGEQEELEAAFLVARRKRLGPYREKKEREANRNRDLGVLSQAGFPYSISKQVIDTFET